MSSNRSKKLDETLSWFQTKWKGATLYLICTSLIALFISSFIFEKNIYLQDINTWVGLLLGFVAALLGIISLYLSFYNLEKTNDLNDKNTNVMTNMLLLQTKIEEKVTNIDTTTREQYKLSLQSSPSISSVKTDKTWEDQ